MYKSDKRLVDAADEAKIWRYMSFTSFYSLLVKKALFFRRMDKYTDQLEGTLLPNAVKALRDQRSSFDYSRVSEVDAWLKQELETIENYKAHTLANSWSLCDSENYSLWKIYLYGQGEGVAITTTVGKLKECFAKNSDFTIYAGKVGYAEKIDSIDIFSVATNKCAPYEYEREYRALLIGQFTVDSSTGGSVRLPKFEVGADVKVDVNALIDKIYISPFCGPWFKDILLSAIEVHLPGFDQKNIIYSSIKDK